MEHTFLKGSRNQDKRKRTGRSYYWEGASKFVAANRGTAAALGNALDPEEKMAGLGKSGNVAVGGGREKGIVHSHQLWEEK